VSKLADLKQEGQYKVLCYGESGTGKTVFATSFPGKIFVHDFDSKVVSAANFWRKHNPEQLGQIDYTSYADIRGKDADSTTEKKFATFHGWLLEMQTAAQNGKFPYGTVVLDSLTTWADLLLLEVLRQTRTTLKGPIAGRSDIPGMQHYGINSVVFKDYLTRFLALPCNVVVTAHIETEKDEITGALERKPKASGKLASWLPIVFGEVYRAYVDQKDNKTRYMLQTQTDTKFNCRSQIGLAAHIESAYKNLKL